MKAEERFVNKEKLKLYLNVDNSDLCDVTPNHHNLKEVGKNAGLVLNIRWEKNMIYKKSKNFNTFSDPNLFAYI